MALSLQEISDRLEIEALLVRYCHAIDQRDWDAYRAVYTADAVIDDVSAGPGNSVDDMVEFLSRALERVVLIQHAVSTMLIEIDGDTATARTVCHCPVVLDGGDGETQMFFQGLWYVDELVRTPGGSPSGPSATTSTTCRLTSASSDGRGRPRVSMPGRAGSARPARD
jgi:ketosteroid isomerase-like protein